MLASGTTIHPKPIKRRTPMIHRDRHQTCSTSCLPIRTWQDFTCLIPWSKPGKSNCTYSVKTTQIPNGTLSSFCGYIKQNHLHPVKSQNIRSVCFVFVCVSKERLPAGNILLFFIILLWGLWSSSGLVLLHYPHASCLHWNTDGTSESCKPSWDGNCSQNSFKKIPVLRPSLPLICT